MPAGVHEVVPCAPHDGRWEALSHVKGDNYKKKSY